MASNPLVRVITFIFTSLALNFSSGQSTTMQIQTGHSGTITCLALDSSSHYMASGAEDGKILLWNYEEGTIYKSLKTTGNPIKIEFISSSELAIMSDQKILTFWNFLVDQTQKTAGIGAFAYFNQTRIWAYSKDKSIFLESVSNPSEKINVFNSKEVVKSLDFDVNGHLLIVKSGKKHLRVYDIYKNSVVYHKKLKRNATISVSKFNTGVTITYKRPFLKSLNEGGHFKYRIATDNIYDKINYAIENDQLLAGGTSLGMIHLWKNHHGRFFKSIKVSNLSIDCLNIPKYNSRILLCAGKDRVIRVINLENTLLIKTFSSFITPKTSISYSNEFSTITTGHLSDYSGNSNHITFAHLSGQISTTLFEGNKFGIAGANAIDSKSIVSGGYDNKIIVQSQLEFNKSKKFIGAKIGIPRFALRATPAILIPISLSQMVPLLQRTFKPKPQYIKSVADNESSHYVAFGTASVKNVTTFDRWFTAYPHPIILFNTVDKKIHFRLPGHVLSTNGLAFNSYGTRLASCGGSKNDRIIKIWDLQKKQLKKAYKVKNIPVGLAWGLENNNLYYSDNLKIYNINLTGDVLTDSFLGRGPLFPTSDERFLIFQIGNGAIGVYNQLTQKLEKTLLGHTDKISAFSRADRPERFYSASWDGTIRLWDIPKGEEIASFVFFEDGEFFINTPDNYYYATPNASQRVTFTVGDRRYYFDQFDLLFNRPDIVLERIGAGTTKSIQLFANAFKKRVERSGASLQAILSKTVIPPRLNLVSSPVVQGDSVAVFSILAQDSLLPLDRVFVWNNHVPVYGKEGLPITSINKKYFELSVKVPLIMGRNKIEFSTRNSAGVESLKEYFVLTISKEAVKNLPELYFVGIGAGKFKSAPERNLPTMAKDVQDIAATWKKQEKILFSKVNTYTLLDEEVTSNKIQTIKYILQKSNKEDVIVLYFGGHGDLVQNQSLYLAEYETNFSDFSQNGLSFEDLENLLDSIPAYRKLMIVNACRSGETDASDLAAFEQMKTSFVDLRRGNGAWVISSSYGYESSLTEKLGNSTFGEALLSALDYRNIKHAHNPVERELTVSQMFSTITNFYALKAAQERIAQEETPRPNLRAQNPELDFILWHY